MLHKADMLKLKETESEESKEIEDAEIVEETKDSE